MAEAAPKRTIYEDLRAVPWPLVAEIIDGTVVTHPRPAPRHSMTAVALTHGLSGPFQFDDDGPGGWLFLSEPELHLGQHVLVPDLAGWRTERLAAVPETAWISLAPDWVCEILSGSTEKRDRSLKMRVYGEAGVPHMWLIDPRLQLLEAFELKQGAWTKIGDWNSDDQVSARPFDAISFSLAKFWPLDRPLGMSEAPQPLYAGDR